MEAELIKPRPDPLGRERNDVVQTVKSTSENKKMMMSHAM